MSDNGGLNLDFGGGAKASSGFEPIPASTYDARIDELEVRETKDKEDEYGEVQKQTASDGTQARYLNIKYKITSGEYEGRVVFANQSMRFPENALDDEKKERTTREMFLAWLNTVTGTDFAGTNQALNLKDLYGSEVRIVVGQREYQGEIQNDVKKVLPANSADTVDAIRRTL